MGMLVINQDLGIAWNLETRRSASPCRGTLPATVPVKGDRVQRYARQPATAAGTYEVIPWYFVFVQPIHPVKDPGYRDEPLRS